MPRIVEATPSALAEAARRLRAGGVVAFPTETVYGLGALTLDERALAQVYELKGRPADNPLIAHVLDAAQGRQLAAAWPDVAERLAERFWPGPLTIVVRKAAAVPDRATAGRATIAVRAPRHPVAVALLHATGAAISAPSANRSFGVSPTRADHVADDFADVDDLLVLDGGACAVGLESTVLDCTRDPPRILRLGGVTRRELAEAVGAVDVQTPAAQGASPGTAPRHYAPHTPAQLVDEQDLDARLPGSPAAVLCFDAARVPAPHRAIEMPQGAGAYAQRLYAALREADASGCPRILIVRPPESNDVWAAIVDRLRRATS